MKDSFQIVLYFAEDNFYNITMVASELKNKYQEIGDPILLPINNNAPVEGNYRNLIFMQNEDFQITANFQNIAISLSGEYMEKCKDILSDTIDIFLDNNFIRIGFVISKVFPEEKIMEIKHQYLKEENVINSKQFELSWFDNIELAGKTINCWKRYISVNTKEKDKLLLCMFDFNTDANDKSILTKEYIINFIKECKEYHNKTI